MNKKICVVTGANTRIGFEIAKGLAPFILNHRLRDNLIAASLPDHPARKGTDSASCRGAKCGAVQADLQL